MYTFVEVSEGSHTLTVSVPRPFEVPYPKGFRGPGLEGTEGTGDPTFVGTHGNP